MNVKRLQQTGNVKSVNEWVDKVRNLDCLSDKSIIGYKTLSDRNKEMYNAQILAFRNDCENMTEDKGSILADEISSLKEDNKIIMLAIDELASIVLSEKEGEELPE